MNKNDQQFMAQRIRAQYVEKQSTELDELRSLDAKVKRPVNVFSYVFGSVGAVIMGAGMSLVMTEIGAMLGLSNAMVPGIAVGIIGLIMAAVNYPIHKRLMRKRREKYSREVLALSERIINQEK